MTGAILDKAGTLPGGTRTAVLLMVLIAGALALDRFNPLWGQIAAGVATWAFVLTLISRAKGVRRAMLFTCLVWATAGELLCSLGWGLYTYRLGNIPHFVPPGHVLMFLIGLQLAQWVSDTVAHRLTALYAAMTACCVAFLGDQFSGVLFVVYALIYWLEPGLRRLLAVMFALTLWLELCGTALGVWGWQGRVPILGLTTTNPPVAVAAFYCALDALVFATLRLRGARVMQTQRLNVEQPLLAAAADVNRSAGKPAA